MEIRALRPNDDRSAFQSGDEALDLFFHRYAGQNQFRAHIGVTYVAIEAGHILGFATVSPRHVDIEDLPERTRKKLPRYPVPVLGRRGWRLTSMRAHGALAHSSFASFSSSPRRWPKRSAVQA